MKNYAKKGVSETLGNRTASNESQGNRSLDNKANSQPVKSWVWFAAERLSNTVRN